MLLSEERLSETKSVRQARSLQNHNDFVGVYGSLRGSHEKVNRVVPRTNNCGKPVLGKPDTMLSMDREVSARDKSNDYPYL